MDAPARLPRELRGLISDLTSGVQEGQVLLRSRHGNTVNNDGGVLSGWSDVKLSSLGWAQARALGPKAIRCLDRLGIDQVDVFTSDLPRARCTAHTAVINGNWPRGLIRAVHECDWLREVDTGSATGQQYEAAAKADRRVHEALTNADVPFPEGETPGESHVQRLMQYLKGLRDEVIASGDPAWMVSSRIVMTLGDALLFEGILPENPLAYVLAHPLPSAELSVARFTKGRWTRVELQDLA